MATSELPATPAENPSAAALHQLKELLERGAAFAQALGTTGSTEAAARLAAASTALR